MPTGLQNHIVLARRLTRLLDLRFTVFGIRFGIDPLLDMIPGVGNLFAAATSCYLFWIAYRLRVPTRVYLRMSWNILVDYLFGVVPYIGIVFDVFYRSNVKNFALLESYFDPSVLEGEIVS